MKPIEAESGQESETSSGRIKLSCLVPFALLLCLLSTGLYVAGLVVPCWVLGSDPKGPFHYGPFVFCQNERCVSWMEYSRQKESLREKKTHYPGGLCVRAVLCVQCMSVCMSVWAGVCSVH